MSTGKARFVNDNELSSRERGAVGEVVVPTLRSVLCSDTEIFSENFCGDSGRREADNRTGSVFVWCCCNLGREPRKLRFYCVINAMCLCCQAVSNTRLTITASGFG